MIILSILESTYLDESIKCSSRWFILAQGMQNVEIVNLKCITYTQLIWVPLNQDEVIELDKKAFNENSKLNITKIWLISIKLIHYSKPHFATAYQFSVTHIFPLKMIFFVLDRFYNKSV